MIDTAKHLPPAMFYFSEGLQKYTHKSIFRFQDFLHCGICYGLMISIAPLIRS